MASPAIQLATAYVSLVVSTKGVGKDVARELGAVETQAQRIGQSAGQKLVAAFSKNKINTKPDQEQLKRLEDAAKRASQTVSRAKEAEEDATRKVAIAQKAYEEAVKKAGEGSSRALAAQDRLILAQRKAEGAAHQTAAALDAEERAMKELGDETNKTEGKVQGFGSKFKNAINGAVDKINPFSKFKGNAEKAGKESAEGFSAKVKSGLGGFASSVGKLLGPLAAIGGATAIVGGLKDSISKAGDLEQSVGAVQAIFKQGSDQMLNWSKNAATAVGLTKNEYNELSVILGAQLKNGGTSLDQLAGKTNDLVGVGADLAYMFGGTTADAVGALSSALKGERDPIEKYGVSLKQASIDAKAAELGFKKVGGSFDAEAQQAATLALIMEQTKDAHGNFAKESDTYAHKVQVLSAKFEDFKTGMGERLLPIAIKVLDWVEKATPAIDWFADGITGVTDILFKGDFNGNVFGLEEDDPIIGVLFSIRDGAVELGEAFQGLTEPGGKAQEIVQLIVEAGEKLVGVWQDNVAPIISQVWETITGAFQKNGPAIEGVVGKVRDAFEKLGTLISDVGAFITKVWEEISPTVLPIIEGFVGAIVGIWDGLWQSIGGIMDLISAVLTGDWEAAGTAVGEIVDGISKAIGAAFQWAYDSVARIMGYLWDKITGVFSDIGKWTGQKVTEITDGVVKGFQDAADGAARWFGDMYTKVTNKAKELKDGVLGFFGDLWAGANKAFDEGVRAVGKIFDGIKDMAKNPVRFVINTVVNDGLIGGVNWLAEKVGLGKPLGRIALPSGFARGGILPGYSSWQQGDDQLIMARRGEGIVVSEVLKDPYERKRMLALNAAAVKGRSLDEVRQHFDGYAKGGVVNYRGVRMDEASSKLLYAAEKLFGRAFSPTQGSFRPRTSYSGGTHMGAGAIDIRETGSTAVGALRRVGGAAWDRTGKGDWMPHIHSIFPVAGLSPSAANQMASYKRGGDGLGGTDNGPRVDVIGGLADLGSKVWDFFMKAGQSVLDFVSAPLKMFNDAISGGMDKVGSIPGGGMFTKVLKGIPNLVIGGIKDWFSDKLGIPKFADGGYAPGGLAVVGERGPELVHLPRGSYVQPNHAIGGVRTITAEEVAAALIRVGFAEMVRRAIVEGMDSRGRALVVAGMEN